MQPVRRQVGLDGFDEIGNVTQQNGILSRVKAMLQNTGRRENEIVQDVGEKLSVTVYRKNAKMREVDNTFGRIIFQPRDSELL